MYLNAFYGNYMRSIKSYYDRLISAVTNDEGDAELVRILIEGRELKKEWETVYDRFLNFDYQDNLEDVINSGIRLPQNISKEAAYQICMKELNGVSYTPSQEGRIR